jgi:hypothetical protein
MHVHHLQSPHILHLIHRAGGRMRRVSILYTNTPPPPHVHPGCRVLEPSERTTGFPDGLFSGLAVTGCLYACSNDLMLQISDGRKPRCCLLGLCNASTQGAERGGCDRAEPRDVCRLIHTLPVCCDVPRAPGLASRRDSVSRLPRPTPPPAAGTWTTCGTPACPSAPSHRSRA